VEFLSNNVASISQFKPELVLIAGILLLFISDLIFRQKWLNLFVAIVTILFAALLAGAQLKLAEPKQLFNNLVVIDHYSSFFKIFFLLTALLTILIISKTKELKDAGSAELSNFILTITLGMILVASSADLLMIYLSIETVSLLSYILVGYKLDSKQSSEAALKYIIFGAVASGTMLFGISYFYGIFGTTNIFEIQKAVSQASTDIFSFPILFATIFVMVGFGFKIAMVPFHMWCPDVYEGAPTPITAFLSVGPKAAGFAVLVRFFLSVFGIGEDKFVPVFMIMKGPELIIILSIVTMTLGNLAAIPQTSVKRLLAYSSIAHAGYILMGVAAFDRAGVEAVLFYLPVYLFMNLSAFLIVQIVEESTGNDDIKSFKALGRRNPFLAFSMAVFLFSLTGLPPLAGFLAKFYIFAAVIDKGLYLLAIIGVLNSVVSLFYYVRIVKAMYIEGFSEKDPSKLDLSPVTIGNFYKILTCIFLIFNIALIFYWAPLLKIVQNSALTTF
jgi:NADH-quinone oxidoreductase subunit N